MGIVPQSLRKHIDRFLRDNSEQTDAVLGSVDVEGGELIDPGGTVHTGTIGGGVDDSGNVLGGSTTDSTHTAVNPDSEVASGFYGTALGAQATADGGWTTALGAQATADADWTTAVGHFTDATSQSATAVGYSAAATADTATAVGNSSEASAGGAIGIGNYTLALDEASVAIGDEVESPAANCGRIGVDQLVFGASSGAVPDGNLNNGELAVDADEANSQFQIRYKDTSGNIQTGTISFD